MSNKKSPPAPTIPLDLWRELYQAAASFQLLAPWQWIDDMWAVQHFLEMWQTQSLGSSACNSPRASRA